MWKSLKGMWKHIAWMQKHNASCKLPKIRVDNHIRFLCQNLKKKNISFFSKKKKHFRAELMTKIRKESTKSWKFRLFSHQIWWLSKYLSRDPPWKTSLFCLAFLVFFVIFYFPFRVCSRNWKTLIIFNVAVRRWTDES